MATTFASRYARRLLRISILLSFALGLLLFTWTSTTRSIRRTLRSDLVLGKILYGTSEGESHRAQISAACRAHGFSPLSQTYGKRQVFDLFLLSTELDWLEIRLHTLGPFVDFFVIVESRTTFTGIEKPLYLQRYWDKFSAYHDKIIYRIVEDPGATVGSRTWDHEDYMRNALFDKIFPELVGTEQEARLGDVLIVSDIDEIPKPATVALLRHCYFPARLTLRSHFYYYSFQWLHRGEQWAHPQATTYQGLKDTVSPKNLRNGEGTHGLFFLEDLRRWWQKAHIKDAAWHCSSCFATLEEMRIKMQSFSHTPWNTAENRDEQTMLSRVRQGEDLFGRAGETYQRIDHNQDVPQYVLEHKHKFGYLLDRDTKNAGFTDVAIDKSEGDA